MDLIRRTKAPNPSSMYFPLTSDIPPPREIYWKDETFSDNMLVKAYPCYISRGNVVEPSNIFILKDSEGIFKNLTEDRCSTILRTLGIVQDINSARLNTDETPEKKARDVLREYAEIYPSWDMPFRNKSLEDYIDGKMRNYDTATDEQLAFYACLKGAGESYDLKFISPSKRHMYVDWIRLCRMSLNKASSSEIILTKGGVYVTRDVSKSYENIDPKFLLSNMSKQHLSMSKQYPITISHEDLTFLISLAKDGKNLGILRDAAYKVSGNLFCYCLDIDDLLFFFTRGYLVDLDYPPLDSLLGKRGQYLKEKYRVEAMRLSIFLNFTKRFIKYIPMDSLYSISTSLSYQFIHFGVSRINDSFEWPRDKTLSLYQERENFLIYIEMISTSCLMSKLGLYLPLNVETSDENVLDYLFKNLHDYMFVSSRKHKGIFKNDLESKTDHEIFSEFKMYIPYRDRSSLISDLTKLRTIPRFFLPLKTLLTSGTSLNSSTTLGTNIDDPDSFFICYGTVSPGNLTSPQTGVLTSPQTGNLTSPQPGQSTKYNTYELQELELAFEESNEGKVFFKRPDNIRSCFSLKDVEVLEQLFQHISSCFPSISGNLNAFHTKLKALIDRERLNRVIGEELMSRIKSAGDIEKQEYMSFLGKLLPLGMYCRNWKGPGNPYPIKNPETKGEADHLAISGYVHDLTARMDNVPYLNYFCEQILTIEYEEGKPSLKRSTLKSLLTAVRSEEACIRMASREFVGTSIFYIEKLFEIDIASPECRYLDKIL